MIVFANTITPRLTYILDFISNEIYCKPFLVTTDEQQFTAYEGAKINYSDKQVHHTAFWLPPHTLLFEKGVKSQVTECIEWNQGKIFFTTGGDFPFDVFAASFYLLSRYEEYGSYQKDMYGRYAHENSLAFKEGFLSIPLVNQWLQLFSKSLNQKFPFLSARKNTFRFLPTYDIDEAFSYKHKGLFRTVGGIAKDILKAKWKRVSSRIKVLMERKEDPFSAYDWMDQLHLQFNLEPRYFFLVAAQTGKYDKNISPGTKVMESLIRAHNSKYAIGIHPSWQSGDDSSLLQQEIQTLQTIAGKEITCSRQHFIRFSLPDTYRLLIAAGIKEDYSMGYGSINGFRASVASSYYWYDLEKEEQTGLLLHPFCYMEANSYYEQGISSGKAIDEILYFLNEVKKVNGKLITIWHNTFLGTEPAFSGWREIYHQFIKEATR